MNWREKRMQFLEQSNDPWYRCSGRSTAIALNIISTAMLTPMRKVNVYDHYVGKHHGRHIAIEHTYHLTISIIQKLKLDGFIANPKDRSFTFTLDPSITENIIKVEE